ncbi:MAG TPA: porin family protein [Thermoanaerobaculia bacterium]|jgi:outer membrane protein W
MRRFVLTLLTLLPFSAFAQSTPDHPLRVSLFASDLGYTESSTAGGDWTGGFGLALEYRFRPTWAAEVSAAYEDHTTGGIVTSHGFFRREEHTLPIDVLAQYHFATDSRFKPYLGAGARYVRGTALGNDRTSAELAAGFHLFLTPSLSLRVDAKQLLRNDSPAYDARTKTSIGFGWRF